MKTRLLRCAALRGLSGERRPCLVLSSPRPGRGGLLHPIMHVTWLWECVTATNCTV